MPQIKPYIQGETAQGGVPGRAAAPTQIGESMMAAGTALARYDYVQREEQARAEVSDIQTKVAQAREQWTIELRRRADEAPLGDTTFAEKFDKDFGEHMAKIGEGITTPTGQQTFARLSAGLSGDLRERAWTFQANSVGLKAKSDYITSLDAQRNALLSDPTQFQSVLTQATAALNDPAGQFARLNPKDREELGRQTREGLALSAVQGTIVNGAAELAKRQLTEGKWDAYLDADKKAQMLAAAETGINAARSAKERERAEAKLAQQEKENAAMNGLLSRIVTPSKQNGGVPTDKEILGNPDLDWQAKQHLIDYKMRRVRELESRANERSNPGEVRRLMLEIHAANDDPTKTYNYDSIMKSYREGKIKTEEMNFLRREVDQLRDGTTQPFQKDVQAARNAVYTALTRSVQGQVNPAAAADAAYRFNVDLETQIARKRAANEDPRTLLTPGHRDYLLSRERVESFMGQAGMSLQGEADGVKQGRTPPVAARREAASQYVVGQSYDFNQGKFEYTGGPPNNPGSWKKVQGAK